MKDSARTLVMYLVGSSEPLFFKKKEKKKKPKTKQIKKKQQKKAGKTREMHENKKGREGRAKVLFLLIKYANFVASSLSRRRRYLEVAIVFD